MTWEGSCLGSLFLVSGCSWWEMGCWTRRSTTNSPPPNSTLFTFLYSYQPTHQNDKSLSLSPLVFRPPNIWEFFSHLLSLDLNISLVKHLSASINAVYFQTLHYSAVCSLGLPAVLLQWLCVGQYGWYGLGVGIEKELLIPGPGMVRHRLCVPNRQQNTLRTKTAKIHQCYIFQTCQGGNTKQNCRKTTHFWKTAK